MLSKERKGELIKEFAKSENDTGSCEVQIAIITERIKQIADHLKQFSKDHSSRRGLLKLVGKRKRFLNYLSKHSQESYTRLVGYIKSSKAN